MKRSRHMFLLIGHIPASTMECRCRAEAVKLAGGSQTGVKLKVYCIFMLKSFCHAEREQLVQRISASRSLSFVFAASSSSQDLLLQ